MTQTSTSTQIQAAMQWALKDIMISKKVPDAETMALLAPGEMTDIIDELKTSLALVSLLSSR